MLAPEVIIALFSADRDYYYFGNDMVGIGVDLLNCGNKGRFHLFMAIAYIPRTRSLCSSIISLIITATRNILSTLHRAVWFTRSAVNE